MNKILGFGIFFSVFSIALMTRKGYDTIFGLPRIAYIVILFSILAYKFLTWLKKAKKKK